MQFGKPVSRRKRWAMGLIAGTGATVTVVMILTFVLGIVQNSLPWSPNYTVREHYVAVGDSFSQGFMAGFFLCFFLSLVALAIGHGMDRAEVRSHAHEETGNVRSIAGRKQAV